MGLEEQFLNNHSKSGGIGMNEKQANGCVQIAENFAIGFAEWSDNLKVGEWNDKTTKELLEIYKKTL